MTRSEAIEILAECVLLRAAITALEQAATECLQESRLRLVSDTGRDITGDDNASTE